MCAEEFASFLDSTRKAPMEEKINAFGDIIEKIMSIVLRIPDLVDQSLGVVNDKVTALQNQLNTMNSDITTLKSRPAGPAAAAPRAPGGAPGGPPPPPPGGSRPGGAPGGPPPPPPGGSKPGGPAPAPARPANPVSLRGAIMGELKSLFAKRRTN